MTTALLVKQTTGLRVAPRDNMELARKGWKCYSRNQIRIFSDKSDKERNDIILKKSMRWILSDGVASER